MNLQRIVLPALLLSLTAARAAQDSPALMPRLEDYALMSWADGFPCRVPGAPWLRVVRTGRYAMALNVETLKIEHMGGLPGGVAYADAAREDNRAWESLPPADLAMSIEVGGKTYRCKSGGKWTQFTGPRLIESGRFLQRADVTDLDFVAQDGSRLNAEARLETVAWPDRLALILAARPGGLPIPDGESCFGYEGGGFGLTGTNHLEIPHSPELDPPEFTLELQAFVPADCNPSARTHPWLVCKNRNEVTDGNYGIVILGNRVQARLNIGGGREHQFATEPRAGLNVEQWNHVAMSYDGETLRLYLNGALAGETRVGQKRRPGVDGLAIGRRQDNCGDGFHFRGAVDEIRFYDRALTPAALRARERKPVREWRFREDGAASARRPVEVWKDPVLELTLAAGRETLRRQAKGGEVALMLDPVLLKADEAPSPVVVQASEIPGGRSRPVTLDVARGWHCVNLDGIDPIAPPGTGRENDAVERVKLVLANPADVEQTARLMFEKTAHGIRQRIGSAITGMSAVLRDMDGWPTGIPVQLSKNWHNRPEGGVYAGQWFHGVSQIRLPAHADAELELTLAYGHWGGIAAASHAQLCLIGWGSNQLWDESALGSWGESICYEPDQAQAQAGILDVRPAMVLSSAGNSRWNWTHNVGGGDFFRLFDAAGTRVPPARMRAAYARQGPCLTEVTYAGRLGDGVEHTATVSLGRTDDMVRGIYRLRLDVRKPLSFSRFVLFQIGADTYTPARERKMALGNEEGLLKEWETQWGGNVYRTVPLECKGRIPWISLHEATRRESDGAAGARANRAIILRSWDARLGGRPAAPWIAEHGVQDSSTADLVPPPGVTNLVAGDFVDATVEHLIVPQRAAEYYGPNEELRAALAQWADTWRMAHREAVGNDRRVSVKTGRLEGLYPAIAVRTENGKAEFTVTGGLGYVPVTLSGLASRPAPSLSVDGKPLDQSVHGNDFWQTDYDPASRQWSCTFNLPIADSQPHGIRMENAQ